MHICDERLYRYSLFINMSLSLMLDYTASSDLDLTHLIRQDDHKAFTVIYERYWKKMLLVAWNHSKDTTHAKDIVHEVFTGLWERRKSVDIHNLSAFLATAVKFSVFKYYQREQQRADLARKNYHFNELSNGEARLDALFLQQFINGIVEQMPEKCRLVFRYSREMGLKNREIADKINITEKGVEANLTRALKILRDELKNYKILLTMIILLYLLHR